MRYYNNRCDESCIDKDMMDKMRMKMDMMNMDMMGMDMMGMDMMGRPMEMIEYHDMDHNHGNIPSPLPENLELAHAYIPYQQPGKTYTAIEALNSGTVFPELDQPYMPSMRDMDMRNNMLPEKDIWRCSIHG